MRRVRIQVDTNVAALRQSLSAVEIAFSSRANFSDFASRTTSTTMFMRGLEVIADIVAFDLSGGTGRFARAIGTDFARLTSLITFTTVQTRALEIHTDITTTLHPYRALGLYTVTFKAVLIGWTVFDLLVKGKATFGVF